MSKYDSLETYLRRSNRSSVPMTFGDIEAVVGQRLPDSAHRHRAWWSNNPSNNVMTKAWVGAGYRSENVDLAEGKVVFRRVDSVFPAVSPKTAEPRRKLFGALKGMLRIKDGTDLTKPADERWGAEGS